MNNLKINLALLDDHKVFTYGLRSILELDPSIVVIGAADKAPDAFKMLETSKVDVMLVDISMPGLNGIEFLKRVRKSNPEVKVIMLTAHEDEDLQVRAFRFGAWAYVHKSSSAEELLQVIKTVASGRKYLTPEQGTEVLSRFEDLSKEAQCNAWNLTASDLRLLAFLAEGRNYAEIAESLHVSETTVKRMVASILSKMGAANRTHAVSMAMSHALI